MISIPPLRFDENGIMRTEICDKPRLRVNAWVQRNESSVAIEQGGLDTHVAHSTNSDASIIIKCVRCCFIVFTS